MLAVRRARPLGLTRFDDMPAWQAYKHGRWQSSLPPAATPSCTAPCPTLALGEQRLVGDGDRGRPTPLTPVTSSGMGQFVEAPGRRQCDPALNSRSLEVLGWHWLAQAHDLGPRDQRSDHGVEQIVIACQAQPLSLTGHEP